MLTVSGEGDSQARVGLRTGWAVAVPGCNTSELGKDGPCNERVFLPLALSGLRPASSAVADSARVMAM